MAMGDSLYELLPGIAWDKLDSTASVQWKLKKVIQESTFRKRGGGTVWEQYHSRLYLGTTHC